MKIINNIKLKSMGHICKYIVSITLVTVMMSSTTLLFAGNKDRSGQAGATELLINPWARSSGLSNSNTASVSGIDATFINVAGLSHTLGTQAVVNYTNYLNGSGVNIFGFGVAQQLGQGSVLGLSVQTVNFGEEMITTEKEPDGTLGTFTPNNMVIGLSYAKAFSNSIFAGVSVKIINESIFDVSATGVAIDAGIQYITGDKENIKLGMTLKNVGTNMKFAGDGLTLRGDLSQQGSESTTPFSLNQRTEGFELPTTLQIGVGYDFLFGNDCRLSILANFRSMAFGKDNIGVGLEGSLWNYWMLRAGYTFESGQWDDVYDGNFNNLNVEKGFACGTTIQYPFKNKKSFISIDYSYRMTEHWNGTHCIGAIFNF